MANVLNSSTQSVLRGINQPILGSITNPIQQGEGGFGGGSGPLSNLLSWWDLGEASGNRLDSFGANTLTETGTISTITGQEGANLAADFQSSERLNLSAGHGLGVDVNNVLHFCMWIRPEVSFIPHYFIHQGTDYQTSTALGWSVRRNSTTLSLRVGADTGARTECDFGTLANVTWGFIDGYIDWDNEECGAALNGGSYTTASLAGKTKNTTSFAQYMGFAQPSYYGRFGMQSVGIYSAKMEAATVASLYNGGVALRFADLS